MMKGTWLLLLITLLAAPASAQTFARRRVPQGEVTGLEMGIEGTLSAVPGGRLRWYLTLYEVVRRTDLRVSAGSIVRATASSERGEPLAELTTDAAGRAVLDVAISEELVSAPYLMLEAISPRGIRRVFEVSLQLEPRFAVELLVDRDVVPPGATLVAFGRVLDRARGLPAAAHELVLRASSAGPLGPPTTLTTDAAGVFSLPIALPSRTGDVTLSARIPGHEAAIVVQVRESARRPLVLAARPEALVVAPGVTVRVEALVRTPEGVPVEGAQIGWREQAHLVEEDRVLARTDAQGRARLAYPMLAWIGEPYADQVWTLEAVHPAHGTDAIPVVVRIARERVFATWAVEGGALVPELEGRVLVRLVGADGAPLAAREVSLDVARLGGRLMARSDASGVALFSGTLGPAVAAERCGGPTAAAAELSVDGHEQSLCLPVDLDATLALRTSAVEPSGRARVEILRRAGVARAPVVVTALARRGEQWAPVAEGTAAPGASSIELELPPEISGEVWLRARPVLDARQIRGGGTLSWLGPSPRRLGLSVDAEGARVEGTGESATLAVFALEPERADALLASARSMLGPVGGALDEGASEAAVRLLLASRTLSDDAVSAVLRDGELVTLPLPAEPAREGLLRDPWRTRARFVRGRIGRLMGAVEDYVAERVPGRAMEDVAVREGGRFRFNTDLLEGALPNAGLGGEGAATLDGEPLDITGLRAMDASFTYDNVARRITRERLWRVLRMLRQLVRDRQLDVGWARQGEPAQYLVAMLETHDIAWEDTPERDALFDAWGTPFALRPARGRARFAFLEPVPGWELVSAGPDQRLATGDDMADPFVRVLPSGSLYAEAVGEDALLARLEGVELGRATAESLAELFEVAVPEYGDPESVAATASELPQPIEPMVIGPVPVPGPLAALGAVGPLSGGARAWTLPPERRRYAAVALRFDPAGPPSSGRAELVAGAPYAVRIELPRVMRPGEALEIPLSVVRLGDVPAPQIEITSRGDAIRVSLEGDRARLVAERAGVARISVTLATGGGVVWTREAEVRVVPTGRLRARHASALVEGPTSLAAETPAGAAPWGARLILTAPRALGEDPMLAAAREAHPAPFAWASALRGEDVDPALLARIERGAAGGTGLGAGLEAACALTALATAEDRRLLAPLTRVLSSGLSEELLDRASVLAALAPSAPGAPSPHGDSVGALALRIREDGWRALASTSDRPSVMARMAAALLLVDRRDAPGLALLARARASLERDAHGRAWVPGEAERAGDGWIGTLALAIAARQAGEDALATELARSAASRLYLASRTGVEGAFWALAASVYGAFGVDPADHVELSVDGREQRVELTGGRAELALSPSSRVELRGGSVLARVESRFIGEPSAGETGPLTASIEGDPGRLGDRSALELVIEGNGEEVGAPIVEIVLPGAAVLDEGAYAALRRSDAVARVEPVDGAGVVRVHLRPLRAGGTHRVPLPCRWIATGRTRGFDVTLYDASRPWALRSIPGRTFDVAAQR